MKELKSKGKTLYTIGRPITYTYERKLEILENLIKYIEKEDYPTVPEFCVKNNLHKQRLYDFVNDDRQTKDDEGKEPLGKYFWDSLKRMNEKQEAYIEVKCMSNEIPIAFGIFKLKNLGWRDKPKEEEDSNQIVEALKILGSVKEAVKKELENE